MTYRDLRLPTARAFKPLLGYARDKAAWGGRGSGKSHFFGDQTIKYALASPGDYAGEGLRMVCLREVQQDLAQSSKALIESKIRKCGLTEADGFKVYRDVIRLPGDGIVIFKGMNDFNAESIKSLEDYRVSWWEEAATATARSIQLLRPTMRAANSEMWWSWNPTRRTDAVDVLFRGPEIPTGAKVVSANWRDNPWLTHELRQERADCLRMTPDQYPHVWEGDYVTVITGAYYAKDILQARAQGRIGLVGMVPTLTRRVFCDLGGTGARADAFVMWVAQFEGKAVRVIDYYETVGQAVGAHLMWLETRGYTKDCTRIYLPHDGDTKDRIWDNSFATAFEGGGYRVEVIPNQGQGAAKKRIEAARTMWPMTWIHEPACGPGLAALGWYHEKRDDKRGIGLGPDHDWSSHAADAWGLMGVVASQPRELGPPPHVPKAGASRRWGRGRGSAMTA